MKPRVFIGSSSEGLKVAYALQAALADDGEITVWTQDVFRPSQFTCESLLEQLGKVDAGIFVFSADDVTQLRGVEHSAIRDNVVFEFGLFVGRLGRDRAFIVAPKGGNPRLPSDLLGVNVATFDADRSDGNLEAALGPASYSIRELLRSMDDTGREVPREFAISLLARKDLLSDTQRKILSLIEAKRTCSTTDLRSALPNMPKTELHYRLEQLRLMGFVSATIDPKSPGDARFSLTAGYRRTVEARNLRGPVQTF